MKKNLLSFLALFISLSIYFSCTDEGVEVSGLQRINPDSDLLAYAMNLVGENGEGCSLIDLQKGSTNSRAVTDYSTVATPFWDKAKTEQHGDEEVLIVPLQGEDDIYSSMYFEEEEMGRLYQTKTFSRLVIRSKNGVNTPQIFTYLPGRNYAKNRQAVLDTMGFSPLAVKYYGTILISDLEGKFQQGFFYERGVPTIHLKAKQHTHTDACCSGDDTACDNHEHSHSLQMRLKFSGNMTVTSRSVDDGDVEVDPEVCPMCGFSDCTCSKIEGEENEKKDTIVYDYCTTCWWPKEECKCPEKCKLCGKKPCICIGVCMACKKNPCICTPKRCEHCLKFYCTGECKNPKPDGGNSEGTPDEELETQVSPKASELFYNPDMSATYWRQLEILVEEIDDDCLGGALCTALKNILGGSTIPIHVMEAPAVRFSHYDPVVGITLSRDAQSFHLFYEMMHAYLAHIQPLNTLNCEIEALYAQHLYLNRQIGFNGSEWERRYNSGMIFESVQKLEEILDAKGQLKSGKTTADVVQAVNKVVEALRKSIKFNGYIFDESKNGLENFNNLRILTSGC